MVVDMVQQWVNGEAPVRYLLDHDFWRTLCSPLFVLGCLPFPQKRPESSLEVVEIAVVHDTLGMICQWYSACEIIQGKEECSTEMDQESKSRN